MPSRAVLVERDKGAPAAPASAVRIGCQGVEDHDLAVRSLHAPARSGAGGNLLAVDERGCGDPPTVLHHEKIVEHADRSLISRADVPYPAYDRISQLLHVVDPIINGGCRGNVCLACSPYAHDLSQCFGKRNAVPGMTAPRGEDFIRRSGLTLLGRVRRRGRS